MMGDSREDIGVTVLQYGEVVDEVQHVPASGFSFRRLGRFIGPGLLMSIAYVVSCANIAVHDLHMAAMRC